MQHGVDAFNMVMCTWQGYQCALAQVRRFGQGPLTEIAKTPRKKVRGRKERSFCSQQSTNNFATMNAEAYLRKQGWQGSGHSLDGEGRGIKKPLLIAHKQDQLGLGKKKAAYTTDDQWWMRAFDDSLKNIGSGKEVCRSGALP
jgi:hypothetical protein